VRVHSNKESVMRQIVERLRSFVQSEGGKPPVDVRFRVQAPTGEAAPDVSAILVPHRNAMQSEIIDYLRSAARDARKLTRCTLSASKRIQAAEAILKPLVPIVFKQIQAFSPEGGVPDPEPRQVILDTLGDVLRPLAESYKIVFRDGYNGSRYSLSDAKKHLEFSAFRILDLTQLQQRVRALRYQPLQDTAWLAVNNVFHAVYASGAADSEYAPLETLAPEGKAPATQSITDMFLSLHLVSRFDLLRWPTEWHGHIFAYCRSVSSLVQISDGETAELPRGATISYAYDNGPGRSRPSATETEGPGLVLDWTKLIKAITADYLQMFVKTNEFPRKVPERLITLPHNERLAMAQLQFECLTGEPRPLSSNESAGKIADMRIFIGFKAVYALLLHIQGRSLDVGTRLADVLAKRSAKIAEDHIATVESVWYVQHENAKMIRLKTQETRFTTEMRVGALAAYGIGNDGIAKPLVGVISRIQRPSATTVAVEILKQGYYVEPVMVSPDAATFDKNVGEDNPALAAIVVRDNAGESKLVLPPLSKLQEGDQLAMRVAEQTHLISVAKLQWVTRGLFLFRFRDADAA
jgi:hypothetical protein